MILKALCDYYDRCGNLPTFGMEKKEIGFIIVISKEGKFVRFEDCRIGKNQAMTFLVRIHVDRSSGILPNYLYDNSTYVLGYADVDKEVARLESKKKSLQESDSPSAKAIQEVQNALDELLRKRQDKENECLAAFVEKTERIQKFYPDNADLQSLCSFYKQNKETILSEVSRDSLWEDIKKNLSKKYSIFSFRIDGDRKIIAEKREILQLDNNVEEKQVDNLCLVTGRSGTTVETTAATMIPGSQAKAKLVSFQVNSGYDSYGKKKCSNAPISKEAEFAYTTALNVLLRRDSHNKFNVGNRTFVFWASFKDKVATQTEESLFNLLGYADDMTDNPNEKIEHVRKVFQSIHSGHLGTGLDDRFYILGLAPNAARIAVVYWLDDSLREFAGMIVRHFDDMEIVDYRVNKKPYAGLKSMLAAVTPGGKQSEATPNLPEAVIKSIFQGLPYPYSLFSACIRRVRAESGEKNVVNIGRAAILKAYLNRTTNQKKIKVMLDPSNTNQGYLCGRLFAVLDKMQEDANGISSIRERYMNAASATPASVFATILNLSAHHLEKLPSEGRKVFYEKLKQEIIDKIPATGFPAHLDLQDQGRFFIGYYHQRQDFFKKKD